MKNSTPTRIRVAAVVVTHNRKTMLIECLNALIAQTYRIDRIYIVDNASTDGTWAELKNHGFSKKRSITYLRLPQNEGGAGGFYAGVKAAHENKYDWIWLMDDDAEPKHDALEILLAAHSRSHGSLSALACLKVDLRGHIERIHRGWFNREKSKPEPLSDEQYEQDECDIGYSSFVGLLINANAVEKAGYPNKDFFIWLDDVEYSLRLSRAGGLKLVTKSIIVHKDEITRDNSKTVPIDEYWKIFYGVRNRTYLLSHNFRQSRTSLFLKVLAKGLLKIILFENNKFVRMRLFYRAWRDGVIGHLGKKVDPITWRKRFVR